METFSRWIRRAWDAQSSTRVKNCVIWYLDAWNINDSVLIQASPYFMKIGPQHRVECCLGRRILDAFSSRECLLPTSSDNRSNAPSSIEERRFEFFPLSSPDEHCSHFSPCKASSTSGKVERPWPNCLVANENLSTCKSIQHGFIAQDPRIKMHSTSRKK